MHCRLVAFGLVHLILAWACTLWPEAVVVEEPLQSAEASPPATWPARSTAKATREPPEKLAPAIVAVPPTVRSEPRSAISGIEVALSDGVSALTHLPEAGAVWTRINGVRWSEVEPTPGDRRWDRLAPLETFLLEARRLGIEVILIVRSTPAWAQAVPGKYCGPIAPARWQAFGEFLFDLVSRYSAEPFAVKHWEIWNEPDGDIDLVRPQEVYGCQGDFDKPYFGGMEYGRMLKAVAPVLRRASPEARLLVGGLMLECRPGEGADTACPQGLFLEGILRSEGRDAFDGVSFHGYDGYLGEPGQYANASWPLPLAKPVPALVAKTLYIRDLFEKYGLPSKPLYASEVAVICGRTGQEPPCQGEDFEITKAAYAASAVALSRALDLEALIWYSLSGWRGSGLVNVDTGERSMAYAAFAFANALLGQAEVISWDGARVVEFASENRQGYFVLGGVQVGSGPSLEGAVTLDVLGRRVEFEDLVDGLPYYVLREGRP